MNGFSQMVEEHVLIKRMLPVFRWMSYGILKGNEINYDDFNKMLDFARNFVDVLHQGKEEEILFTRMIEEIGGPAEKVVRLEMMVEHDLSRLYIKDLEEALGKVKSGDTMAKIDVIANAVSYAKLMSSHIKKENTVAYPLAKGALSKESLEKLDEDCTNFVKNKVSKEAFPFATQVLCRENSVRKAEERTDIEKNFESYQIKMKYLSIVQVLEAKYVFNESGISM